MARAAARIFRDLAEIRAAGATLGRIACVALSAVLALAPHAGADCTPSPYCSDLCLPPLCNSYDQPYACRPMPAASDNDVIALTYLGYRAKDFTLFESDGLFHLFYIMQFGNSDTSSTLLGHDVSPDLVHWTAHPPVLPIRPDGWDAAHVWSPFVVQRDSFYLFYTGVDSSGRQAIGLASSTDLENWNRRDAPIFSCAQVPWVWCDATESYGQDFRDPFVMPDPDSTGRWMMFYATRLADTTAVPGLALSSGDFGAWRDAGPLWRKATNWFDDARQLESPHVFFHDGTWFLFYTTNSSQPVEFQTTTGSPADSLGWGNWNRLANLDCVDIPLTTATEYLHDSKTGEDLLADANFGRIEIRRMRWWTDSTYFSLLTPGDRVPPRTVTDLGASVGRSTAVLHWTAPGDDGDGGRATAYDLRCGTSPLSEDLLASARRASTSRPDTVGTRECVEIHDLKPGTRYWFALRSYDEAGNESGVSNIVAVTTRGTHDSEVMCGYDDSTPVPPFVSGGGGEDNGGTPIAELERSPAEILQPVYPNPSRGSATLHFALPQSSVVTVEIFEPGGRRVRTLLNAWEAPGPHSLRWDGRDAAGSTVAPGVYLYRWSAGATRGQGKIDLVR